jgi:hypothetical protein
LFRNVLAEVQVKIKKAEGKQLLLTVHSFAQTVCLCIPGTGSWLEWPDTGRKTALGRLLTHTLKLVSCSPFLFQTGFWIDPREKKRRGPE